VLAWRYLYTAVATCASSPCRRRPAQLSVDPVEHVDGTLLREAKAGVRVSVSRRDVQRQPLPGDVMVHELRHRPLGLADLGACESVRSPAKTKRPPRGLRYLKAF